MRREEQRLVKGVGCLFVFFAVLVIQVVGVDQVCSEEKYPTRAIDIIVTYPPGGVTDLGARITAEYLKKKWNVPVHVINKPGGNTVPGVLEVYRATPDGYTMLADIIATSSLLGAAVKDLPFKILDRTFVSINYVSPTGFFVAFKSPLKTLKDLEVEVKKDPENFTWTLMGGASGPDYQMRQFLRAIRVDISKTRPVLIQGGSQGVALVAGGNVKVAGFSISAALPAVQGSIIRALAVSWKNRLPELPDVPTAIESGYPVEFLHWFGYSGPPKLSAQVIDRWDKAMEEMSKDPDTLSKLKNIGAIPFYLNSTATREHVVKEFEEINVLWGLK